MINLVIPMAGRGSRFSEAGFTEPKPLIKIRGQMMIELVLENLALKNVQVNTTLIALRDHVELRPEAFDYLSAAYGVNLVLLDAVSDGTARSILAARDYIDSDVPLLLANCDQIIDIEFDAFIESGLRYDGSILVFREPDLDPKWSYAKVDDRGYVIETKEKFAISNLATVGIYFFREGRDFAEATDRMIEADDRVNGEFYVCPTYNYLIADGKNVIAHEIDPKTMHGLGTPADLACYLDTVTT